MVREPLALVMVPKDDVLIVALGLPNFVRLNRANVSKRNWNLRRSLMEKFLNTETLAVCEPGPKSRLQPVKCPRPQLEVGACTKFGR